nr:hypothetical protein CFP56_28552 [Quercus suber]
MGPPATSPTAPVHNGPTRILDWTGLIPQACLPVIGYPIIHTDIQQNEVASALLEIPFRRLTGGHALRSTYAGTETGTVAGGSGWGMGIDITSILELSPSYTQRCWANMGENFCSSSDAYRANRRGAGSRTRGFVLVGERRSTIGGRMAKNTQRESRGRRIHVHRCLVGRGAMPEWEPRATGAGGKGKVSRVSGDRVVRHLTL